MQAPVSPVEPVASIGNVGAAANEAANATTYPIPASVPVPVIRNQPNRVVALVAQYTAGITVFGGGIVQSFRYLERSRELGVCIISFSILGLLILFISGILTLRNVQLGRQNRNSTIADVAEMGRYTAEFGMAIVASNTSTESRF